MKRVAVIAASAVAVSLAWWVACEATGIEVRTGRMVAVFAVALATFFAIDFARFRQHLVADAVLVQHPYA